MNDNMKEEWFVNQDIIEEKESYRRVRDDLSIQAIISDRSYFLNFFAIKMFKKLPRTDKNHVICPVDLFSSFALLYIASSGQTYTDLQEFLECKSWEPSFTGDTILKTVQSVLQVFAYDCFKSQPNYVLINVIRLLMDRRAKYSDKYRIFIKKYFNVDIDRIDFERDCDLIGDQLTEVIQNELTINSVNCFQTHFDKKTQIVILSAVRFKSKWQIQFPTNDITEEDFYGNRKTRVQMMSIFGRSFRYVFITEWDSHIIEIPFADNRMVFILILPKSNDGLNKLLDNLSHNSLSNAILGLQRTKCNIFLPKFKLECDYDFAKLYPNLKVFYNDWELTEIGGRQRIKANNVLHKVFFEINDSGLNPSIIDMTSLGSSQVIKADHPFLFVVKDNRTDTWVFIGKVQSL